jgi:flagellar biosynthesis/type III secretory pathway chaperone
MTPNHQAIFTQLRDHLDAELATHRQLLAVAERKQHDLVAGDMPGFTRALQDEQTALGEAGRLRVLRERLLRAVATVLNAKLPELRLTPLLALLPDPIRSELARRQADLIALLERLRAVNERSQLLIRQGLAFTREILNAIVGATDNTPAYDRRGLAGYTPASSGSLVNLAG